MTIKVYYKDGFFINDNIPHDAIEISYQRYLELIEGQSNNKIIISDENGNPILIPNPPTSYHTWSGSEWILTDEKQAELTQQKRIELIDNIDSTAASISAKWTRFAEEYKAREASAKEFIESDYTIKPSIYITSFSYRAGIDDKSAANLIMQQAQQLRSLQAQLADQRMRKYEIKSDMTMDEMKSVHDDITSKMQQLAETHQ